MFVDSFQFACKNFKDHAENAALARTMGMFNDIGGIVRIYSQNPKTATVRLANLLSMVSGEESESV